MLRPILIVFFVLGAMRMFIQRPSSAFTVLPDSVDSTRYVQPWEYEVFVKEIPIRLPTIVGCYLHVSENPQPIRKINVYLQK